MAQCLKMLNMCITETEGRYTIFDLICPHSTPPWLCKLGWHRPEDELMMHARYRKINRDDQVIFLSILVE